MTSTNNNQSLTPTGAKSIRQTPPMKVASQTKVPTTPPNSYVISPPRAPRPRRIMRSEDMRENESQPSTPSRVMNRLHSKLVGLGADREHGGPRDPRSRSPPKDRSLSYRARSPLSNKHQGGRSNQVLFGPLLVNSTSASENGTYCPWQTQ